MALLSEWLFSSNREHRGQGRRDIGVNQHPSERALLLACVPAIDSKIDSLENAKVFTYAVGLLSQLRPMIHDASTRTRTFDLKKTAFALLGTLAASALLAIGGCSRR